MKENILELIKKQKLEEDCVILAHHYQMTEIKQVADYIGDSYYLSALVSKLKTPKIYFCGVRFMAEMAHMLSPEKKVLIPRLDAGCPMADTINAEDVKELRKKYPNHTFIAYVNTNADVKAEIDICCTSQNALEIVKNVKNDKIVFLPDKNLGNYVKQQVPEKRKPGNTSGDGNQPQPDAEPGYQTPYTR